MQLWPLLDKEWREPRNVRDLLNLGLTPVRAQLSSSPHPHDSPAPLLSAKAGGGFSGSCHIRKL